MVTFNDLLAVPQLGTLYPVAGRQGLNRVIRAVSVMDSPDSYKWLKGGEFILTSAFLYGNDPKMVEYVFENLIAANCAGFGIKKDRFLSDIPESIIQKANNLHFPIIEIPYSYGWSDIFSEFYRLKFEQQGGDDAADDPHTRTAEENRANNSDRKEFGDLLRALVHNKPHNRITAEITQFWQDGYFFIAVISSKNAAKVYDLINRCAGGSRIAGAGGYNSYVCYSEQKGEAAVLFTYYPKDPADAPHKWQYLLFEAMEYGGFDGYISAGRMYKDPRDIETSYSEAKDAMTIGRSIYGGKQCYLYYSVSFLCALYRNTPELVDLSLIEAFIDNHSLARIDAFETLEAYIVHGSSAKTAEALHIHENSLRYRLQRISDFFHFDITETVNIAVVAIQLAFWKLKKEQK